MALQLAQRLLGAASRDHDEARRLRVLDLEVFFFGTAIAQNLGVSSCTEITKIDRQ